MVDSMLRTELIKTVARMYLILIATLLMTTAILKGVSAFGTARILNLPDPILWLTTRQVMWLSCGVELAVVAHLTLGRSQIVKLAVVAWLSFVFGTYRLGLHLVGGDRRCPCLGSATQWLPWLAAHERVLLHGMLAFMLVGALGLLLLLQGRRIPDAQELVGSHQTE
jgi:hypothetical protein